MYEYKFNKNIVGNKRFSRRQYEQIQGSLKLLLSRIEEWNRVAISHGALGAPYQQEAEDLKRMIAWGDAALKNQKLTDVEVEGMSQGSMQYIKAALLYGAEIKQTEAMARVREDWPRAVKDAVGGASTPLLDLANKLNYPPADILSELLPDDALSVVSPAPEWDVFISHASEDKAAFVDQLANELHSRGVKVWYDRFSLNVGDSLRRSIDRGLAHSKRGVVVLSPNFFAKEWPQKELDGLAALETDGQKRILPVWHNIDASSIRTYSPTLADRVAVSSSVGVEKVVDALLQAIKLYT